MKISNALFLLPAVTAAAIGAQDRTSNNIARAEAPAADVNATVAVSATPAEASKTAVEPVVISAPLPTTSAKTGEELAQQFKDLRLPRTQLKQINEVVQKLVIELLKNAKAAKDAKAAASSAPAASAPAPSAAASSTPEDAAAQDKRTLGLLGGLLGGLTGGSSGGGIIGGGGGGSGGGSGGCETGCCGGCSTGDPVTGANFLGILAYELQHLGLDGGVLGIVFSLVTGILGSLPIVGELIRGGGGGIGDVITGIPIVNEIIGDGTNGPLGGIGGILSGLPIIGELVGGLGGLSGGGSVSGGGNGDIVSGAGGLLSGLLGGLLGGIGGGGSASGSTSGAGGLNIFGDYSSSIQKIPVIGELLADLGKGGGIF